MADLDQQTVCPACRYQRSGDDKAPAWQCPSCGIAYAKVRPEPEFADNITCPSCRYTRTAADTNPHWQCPNCGIAYAKFNLKPEYPADATCPRCYYTRTPTDQGPDWQCPKCGADYAADAEPVDIPAQPARALAADKPAAAAPATAASIEAPDRARLPPDLPLRPIALVAALLAGLFCLFLLHAYSCYAIAGVWLGCLIAIWQLLGIKRNGLHSDTRIDPARPQSRTGGAPIPGLLELVIYAIIILSFASGNGMFSQQCLPGDPAEFRAADASLLMPVQ